MVSWLSATGQLDLHLYCSRVSQYMAAPIKGALLAVMRIARYCVDHKELCIFQPWGSDEVCWHMYSNSNQSSCAEPSNKRRSRLSFVATKLRAAVMWGRRLPRQAWVPTWTASVSPIKDSTSRCVIQTCSSCTQTYLRLLPRYLQHLWLPMATSYCAWATRHI